MPRSTLPSAAWLTGAPSLTSIGVMSSLAPHKTGSNLSTGVRKALVAEFIPDGASTLRRRLTEEGTPLRDVLAGARMQVAQELLLRGTGNVTAAAEAAGYSSRSHFTRRFRAVYGSAPGEHRARKAG